MAVTPNSIVTPQRVVIGTAVCTTASVGYGDAPTNTQLLLASQTDGQRVTSITALARATTTAMECTLYASTDGGTTRRFINSALMTAYTVATSTRQTRVDFGYTDALPLLLAPGEGLYAGIGVTNTGVVFRAEGFAY